MEESRELNRWVAIKVSMSLSLIYHEDLYWVWSNHLSSLKLISLFAKRKDYLIQRVFEGSNIKVFSEFFSIKHFLNIKGLKTFLLLFMVSFLILTLLFLLLVNPFLSLFSLYLTLKWENLLLQLTHSWNTTLAWGNI